MTRRDFLRKCDAEYVATLLVKHGGNVTHAARAGAINRQYMHQLMTKYSLKRLVKKPLNRGNHSWRALQ